uniref:Integrase catalytic domain-containing protein n=1 Tax=Lactuca sativa TaxID=4236 RepID=A0A9R1VQE3_LACSA|nr:hypothetical protein LSAT_V11C400160610 [Lactuca sativa]
MLKVNKFGIRARPMADLQVVGGVKKLNNQNYNTWSTCITSYMQGQDLWEVVDGTEKAQPEAEDNNGVLRKWKIEAGKAMFIMKTTVKEDILEHIRDAVTPAEAWKTLQSVFSKKNDTKLQLLENELLSTRMKRIIIHGLKPEFRSFVTAIQGWSVQPSFVEFENLLAGQEALAKQMLNISVKAEDEALYVERSKGKYKANSNQGQKKNYDKHKWNERRNHDNEKGEKSVEKQKSYRSNKKFPFKCYNYGKKGHMARNCPQQRMEEGNAATAQEEEAWDDEARFAQDEHAMALATTTETSKNKLDEWVVDSGCSNHMTRDKNIIQNPVKYGGSRVVVIVDNSKLKIAHVGDVQFHPEESKEEMMLQSVYHVPGMKKNLLSVSQLTSAGHYVLFGPNDVKVYKEFETPSYPIAKGRRSESIYVMSAETAYVDKTKKNQNVDLWHMRLGHVAYDKLDTMMKKKLVNGLPELEVSKGLVCGGCQYGKAHQLPFEKSTYQAKAPLELIHSDVFGPVKQPSVRGMKYMVTFIDDFSRFVWVYFMKEKSETFSKFKEFKTEAERDGKHRVLRLRSDNGGEYLAKEFVDYLREHKIGRKLTCPNTPQQNRVSERKNRHLAEICGSMIHDKKCPRSFLGRSHLRHKMEKKAICSIFVGYDLERKGWRCCDPNSGRCYVSRNIVFDETSSWWSTNHETLPDSDVLKEGLESSTINLNIDDVGTNIEEDIIPRQEQHPW